MVENISGSKIKGIVVVCKLLDYWQINFGGAISDGLTPAFISCGVSVYKKAIEENGGVSSFRIGDQ